MIKLSYSHIIIFNIIYNNNIMNNIKPFLIDNSKNLIFGSLLILSCLHTILYHSLCKALYDNKCQRYMLLYHYFDMTLNISLLIILHDIYTTYTTYKICISNKDINNYLSLRQNYYFNLRNITDGEKLLYYLYRPFYNKKYQSKTNLFLEVLLWFLWFVPLIDILYIILSYLINISFSILTFILITISLIIHVPKIIRFVDNLKMLILQIEKVNKELERSQVNLLDISGKPEMSSK